MEQKLKKSATVLLAFILAISLMLPYGAFDTQTAWADDSTSTPADEDISLTIKAGAATPTDASNKTFKFPNLTVETKSKRPIKSITVQFTSPIVKDLDKIELPTVGKFVRYQYAKDGNVSINVANGATASEWQEYLREYLKITLSDNKKTASIRMIASFNAVESLIDYNSLNGHYYETVQDQVNWQVAFAKASEKTYMGMQGYLVTVTSEEEHNYVFTMIKSNCWMGLTSYDSYIDEKVKNKYQQFYADHGITIPTTTHQNNASVLNRDEYYFWVSGPEAGKLATYGKLKAQNAAPDPDDPTGNTLMYKNWGLEEPNSANNEYCAHFYLSGRPEGSWNDYINTQNCKYVIEYGGMESDEELEDSSTGSGNADVDVLVKVDINIDPTAQTITTEADDVYVGQPLAIKENVNGEYIQDDVTNEYKVKTIIGFDKDDKSKYIYENNTPTRTYYKLKDGGKPGRESDWEPLAPGAIPTHVGTYKVESNATFREAYTDEQGVNHPVDPYKKGSATFKIKKKSLDLTNPANPITPAEPGVEDPDNPDATKDTVIKDVDPSDPMQAQEVSVSGRNYAKTYDGTKQFPGPGTINISDLVEPGAQAYLTYESAEYVSVDAGDNVDLVLHGVKVKGIDAADYSLAGIKSNEDGTNSLTVKGVITPRPITITTSYVDASNSPVTSWTTGVSTEPVKYANNARVYDAALAADGIPQNMLSPNDDESGKPNTIEEVLGEVTYTSITRGGLTLDAEDPQVGTYELIPHFSKVSTKGGANGFLTENGNYYVSFINGELKVKNRSIVNINDDTDGDGTPDPIVITTPVKPGKDDPSKPSNPGKPGGSDDPTNPDNPADPSKPGSSVDVEKIIEEELNKPVDPNKPDGPKKGDKVPEGIDPIITITKGGVEIEEIDPSEPGEYHIHVVYPDPEGTDTVLDITYIIEPEDPSGDPEASFFTVTTKLKGATQGASITPSQNVAKGKDATITWTPGNDAYITMIEVDGRAIDVNARDFTFTGIQANHEVVVTLAEIPVIPASTTRGYYTVTVNKYGATQGLAVSDSAVVTKGDSHQVTWSVEPGTTIKSVMVDGNPLSADQIASGSYTFDKIDANHAVDIVAESANGSSVLRQDDLQVTTQIVGGPGTITGGSTVSKGSDYAVSWQPVIQTTPKVDDPNYAVYEVESVKVNGKSVAGPNDRDLTLSNITDDKNVVVTLKPVTYNVNILKYGNGETAASRTLYKGGEYTNITAEAKGGSYISYIAVDGIKKYKATAAPVTTNPDTQAEKLSVPALLAASVQSTLAGEALDLKGKEKQSVQEASVEDADKAVSTDNAEKSTQKNEADAKVNVDSNAVDQQPNTIQDENKTTADIEAVDENVDQEKTDQVVVVLPELKSQQEAAMKAEAENADVANNALEKVEQSAQALTINDPVFASESFDKVEVNGASTEMITGIKGIAQDHKYVVYFTENGKAPITPETFKDKDGNPQPPSTIETEVTGGSGKVDIIGDSVITPDPNNPDQTNPPDPNAPKPTKPIVTWEVPGDSVVTEIIIKDPEGKPIGTITPKPGEEQKGSVEIPDDIFKQIQDNPGDYKVEIKTEKRVDGDDTKPKQRETKLSDDTQTSFEIATKLTGGPGTISATVDVAKGDNHTVTWEAGEQDGVKYRVAKVIIDGVEHPELVNETSYTFEDLAANHTIEIVVEPIEEEVPENTEQKPGASSATQKPADNTDGDNQPSSTTKTGDYTLLLVGGVVAVGALAVIAMMYARRKITNKK